MAKTILTTLMAKKGIRNGDVARSLNITEMEVCRWKGCRSYVPPKHRQHLADLLGVNVEDILDERGIAKLAEEAALK